MIKLDTSLVRDIDPEPSHSGAPIRLGRLRERDRERPDRGRSRDRRGGTGTLVFVGIPLIQGFFAARPGPDPEELRDPLTLPLRVPLESTLHRPLASGREAPPSGTDVRSSSLSLVVLSAMPVSAWSNGVNGYDSFGTHDWILREAIRALGDDANWVCVGIALRATDDPDSLDGIEHASGTWWHVWDEWGSPRGAVDPKRWRSGSPGHDSAWTRATARREPRLGIMAHLVGDMAQPMHTDGTSAHEHSVHPAFEHAVDERCTAASCILRDALQRTGRRGAYADALADRTRRAPVLPALDQRATGRTATTTSSIRSRAGSSIAPRT